MADAFPQLVAAEQQFINDQYSETMRWAPGYSDCSSFVGKALKSLGITPPGSSVTTDYMVAGDWYNIPRSDLSAGDICVNVVHMVTATGNNSAIGQENPRRNVATGTPEDLMMGTGSFICRRYKNANNVSATAASYTTATQAFNPLDILKFPSGVINFFNMITNPVFPFRVLMVIVGTVLLGITLFQLAKQVT